MQRHEQIHSRLHHIIVNNFIGGMAWGIGATVGLALFFTIVGLVASKANVVPIVGTFVADVLKFVAQNNPHLLK